MKKSIILSLALLFISQPGVTIVTQHDLPAEAYLAHKQPDYLVDMPGEGHGVLIKKNWVVTVAHLIFADYRGKLLTIAGKSYEIEKVIIHHNAVKPPKSLFNGDAKPLMNFLKGTSDIALIKLGSSVEDVSPVRLYTGSDEVGK